MDKQAQDRLPLEKWEYKNEIISTESTPFIDFLNKQGKDGWEYIESERINTKIMVIIFKRKIQQG